MRTPWPWSIISTIKNDAPLVYTFILPFCVISLLVACLLVLKPDIIRSLSPDTAAGQYLVAARNALDKGDIADARGYLGRFNMLSAKVATDGNKKAKEEFQKLRAEADALEARL